MTYREAITFGIAELKKAGITSPTDAKMLLCRAAGCDELYAAVHSAEPLGADAEKTYREYILRRAAREPAAYITGSREFMGLDFEVSPSVLIPRPETELIAEYLIENYADREADIIDICTGSGAIAVSAAYYMKKCRVLGVDISADALAVAGHNAEKHGVAQRVGFVQADALAMPDFGRRFDIAVSNPPYIPDDEVLRLEADVKDYEPHLALCGGDDGLNFYRSITAAAKNFLNGGALLVFEVGFDQADAVAELMKNDFENIGFINDLSGIKRVVYGTEKTNEED